MKITMVFLCCALGASAQFKFEPQLIDANVAIGYGLAIGDVDGDKKPDILLADKKQFVWYRNGDWKRFVMAENLTASDNVCIAARDIDGDGRVEVAVGAQWNPGETSDTLRSGSVHYLIRPADPTTLWTPVTLHHEPTVHRMRWIQVAPSRFQLIVVPLHGRGNRDGSGRGVKVLAYEMPRDPNAPWKLQLVDSTMHLTHNLELVPDGQRETLYVGGKEGVKAFTYQNGAWMPASGPWLAKGDSFGEVRSGGGKDGRALLAGIQPMHGHTLAVYDAAMKRVVVAEGLAQGHALAVASLVDNATVQVVAGWREPDANGKFGVKLFIPKDRTYKNWEAAWIDENGMACEDLQVTDLNGDGKVDIIAAGRSTRNLKIYWNKGSEK